ncbi:hypothetical protein SZ55_1013 [Pseudomonas sp. FeS53a]|nr:hypothetical protein SZ55_1013 [Pseudomonas sp. FeS53a]
MDRVSSIHRRSRAVGAVSTAKSLANEFAPTGAARGLARSS